MADNNDQSLNREAIKFFKALIYRRKDKLGIDTRPVNFAGNIGRHMSRDLKKWFLNKYPNNSDYVKFFLENSNAFHYDPISGDVTTISGVNHSFVRPERLTDLEDECSEATIGLMQLSRNVCEVEFIIVVFKSFVDSLNLKKSYELKTRQLAEDFAHQKYDRMFKKLAEVVANPADNQMKFESDLIKYLDTNYSEVFAVDIQRQLIRLHLQVVECLKKVSEIMDDSIYKVFEHLLAKYLQMEGPKDVDHVFAAIEKRHPFILNHIFGQNQTTADEFTLLDFCQFNNKRFSVDVRVGGDGRTFRFIYIRPTVVEKKEETNSVDEVYISDNEQEVEADEVYISDDEIYCSDEEVEVVSDRRSLFTH